MRWLSVLVLTLWSGVASAESWCAYPLWVHEWGVQAFDDDGRRVLPVNLPAYFHQTASNRTQPSPVRNAPADTGVRALPVLHFYSAGTMGRGDIPVGIEVGFVRGDASAWYPQVDRRRRGPSRQLFWDRLTLSRTPSHARAQPNVAWVDWLRGFDQALWVDGQGESERFVFYESNSRENVALRIRRGDTYARGRRHFVIENVIGHDVHDVFVNHREGARSYVFYAPRIPAGRSAGFVLEEHAVSNRRSATRDRLRTLLIDGSEPTPPRDYRWGGSNDCVMSRNPAVPVETAEGHRLFQHEVDAILRIWAPSFFDRPGTSVVYREDAAYLDAMMPLAIYTDMYNFVKLRRLGLAVWRARLP